jgi:hypothetical protein
MTNTAIKFTNVEKQPRLLPPITVCPIPAYRAKGIYYNNEGLVL